MRFTVSLVLAVIFLKKMARLGRKQWKKLMVSSTIRRKDR
ncbi:hypothetical protein B4168_2462 [Anoxybacillus flavithermus]|nr:hypothetical protein B4168_2462 [Anoxybacillus flavithermus]OAO85318.1 hypothetical protein GT23_3009 [Parageobacillus thermoglucosidasius]